MRNKRMRNLSILGAVFLTLGAAACSQASPPSPTSTGTPEPPRLRDAVLVEGPIAPDGTELGPLAAFRVSWTVKNSGAGSWPKRTQLIPVAGDTLGPSLGVEVAPLAPGQRQTITVDLEAPLRPGEYTAGWQLCTEEGLLFGEVFPVSVVVLEPTPAPATETPVASLTATGGTSTATRTRTPTRSSVPSATRSRTRTATIPADLPKLGSEGPKVVALQYLLRAEGYNLEADGIFGPATESAVMAFQRRVGLADDGLLDDETWWKLADRHEIELGDRGDDVKALQYMLSHMYGYNLAVDGDFGPATRAAVVEFQEAHMTLYRVGVVRGDMWAALIYGLDIW